MSETRVHLREWQTLGPEDTRLRGVHLAGNDARALARRLTDSGIVEIVELYDGIRVRALAHVGRIHVGGLVITIEPKIGSGQLLELLRYTYGLRNLQLFDNTGFATTGQLLQDLICAQLLAEVSELWSSEVSLGSMSGGRNCSRAREGDWISMTWRGGRRCEARASRVAIINVRRIIS